MAPNPHRTGLVPAAGLAIALVFGPVPAGEYFWRLRTERGLRTGTLLRVR
jgi:hypothetical protein